MRRESSSLFWKAVKSELTRAREHGLGYAEVGGWAVAEEGRCSSAVEAYRRALAQRPDWRDAHLNLANALYDLRELDAAAAHYRRAGELADLGDFRNSLARLWLLAQGL